MYDLQEKILAQFRTVAALITDDGPRMDIVSIVVGGKGDGFMDLTRCGGAAAGYKLEIKVLV